MKNRLSNSIFKHGKEDNNTKLAYEELLERKSYLKEENRSPNIGEFKYGKSKNIDQILKGVNAYRYDIYKQSKTSRRIKNLGGGDPIKYKTYKYIKKDINKYLNQNNLSDYPHTAGIDEVKNNLLKYLSSINIHNATKDELLITSSTTHAYTLILQSIMREHDVVIIPTPTYGLFTYGPEKLGGTVEYIELKEKNGWVIDLNELIEKIDSINKELKKKYKNLNYTPRVVAIYNQNPNNPLGISMSRGEKEYLEEFARICFDKKVLIIDDLVYRDSVYDENNIALPLATFSQYKDNVISLFGISKSYSLAGIRSGFVLGNKYIIQDMRDKIFLEMDSISAISQISLASVFNTNRHRVKYRNKFLRKIHKKYLYNLDIVKYFVEGSNSISKKSRRKIERCLSKKEILKYKDGLKDVSIYHNLIPKSGFFILLDFTKIKGKKIFDKPINNDIDLLMEIYKKDKIKFVPGCAFGWNNDSEIIERITFSKPSNILLNDIKALAEIINNIE